MAKKNFSISKMYCVNCHREGISIPRRNGKYREAGHLKNLYCVYCKENHNHVEIKPISSDYNYEDFLLEIEYHNFDEEGNRKKPYRIFRSELFQQKNNLD